MTQKAVAAVAAVLALVSCNLATKGEKIDSYADPRRALLVLDVQRDFTGPQARMPVDSAQAAKMIQAVNGAAVAFRDRGDVVVYIKNVFPRNDIGNLFRNSAAIEGSPGTAFDDRLWLVSDIVFPKDQPDAFSNPELSNYLVANHVAEITVAGVFADQCVYWTSRGGLNRGYSVLYAADAVAASSDKIVESAIASAKAAGAAITRLSE
ncbi:MAG: cysteine hydrolase family protein [Candidatus Competibacteraceae bacterium]|nr:cysteine hydrolase family protein [Candidatus Competibacteraceae bacterium]